MKVDRGKTKASANISIFGSVKRLLANPIVGTVVALVGIPLAIYLTFFSREVRRLTYCVNLAAAIVVKSGEASRLEVLHDGQKVDGDITAAQIAIWNAGNKSIKREDILAPITIKTADGDPILETSVRRTTRDVIGLTIDESAKAAGSLGLDWRILEPNDGLVLQIVYAGSAEQVGQLQLAGTIEGQSRFARQELERSADGDETAFDKWLQSYWGRRMFVLGLLCCIAAWITSRWRRHRSSSSARKRPFGSNMLSLDYWLLVLGGVFCLGLLRLLFSGEAQLPLEF